MKPILQILFILLLSSSSINIPGQLEFTSGLKYTRIPNKEYEYSYSSESDANRYLYKTKIYSLGSGLSYRLKNKIRVAVNAEVSQFNYQVNTYESHYTYMGHGDIDSGNIKEGNFYSKVTSLQLSAGFYIPLVKSGVFNFVLEAGYINNLRIRNDSASGTQTSIKGSVVFSVPGGPSYPPYYTSTTTKTSYSPLKDFHNCWNMYAVNPGLELRSNSDKKINVSAELFYSFTTVFIDWKSRYLGNGAFNLNGFGSRITLLYNLSKDK